MLGLGLFLGLCGAVLPIGAMRPDSPAPARALPRAEKIILFSVDTLRADRLGCYGYSQAPTSPNIDAWARDAVIFDRAYAHAPWTVPSLAALMTGLYPRQLGVFTNETGIAADWSTLPEVLHDVGYRTAMFNSHSVLLQPEMGFTQGFDEVHPEDFDVVLEGEDKIAFSRVEDQLMGWLDRHADDRFFLWIHDMDPHHPETPGNPYLEEPGWATYDAEIRWTDEVFGRLVRRLQALGVWDEVLLVFVADHGEAFDDHGMVGHQNVMYDEVLRVPLIVGYPPVLKAKRVGEPVDLIDLRSTILDLASVRETEPVSGESLVAILDDRRDRRDRGLTMHSRYFFEDGHHELGVRDRWWKLIARTAPSEDRLDGGLPSWDLSSEDTRFELYNLTTDPLEKSDLAGEYPQVVRRLAAEIETWSRDDEPERDAPRLDESHREILRKLGYETADNQAVAEPLPDLPDEDA